MTKETNDRAEKSINTSIGSHADANQHDHADELVAMLRNRACPAGEPWTGDNPEQDHGHTDCWLHHQSADEIERLSDLLAELIPYMLQDVQWGLKLGAPPEDHSDNCPDCDWYSESMNWKRRIDSGELGDVTL